MFLSVENRTLALTAGFVEGTFNVTLRALDSENSSGTGVLFVTVSYTPPNQRPRLEFNGTAIKAGTTLRIDLLKVVRDEEPSTLRWEVLSNNSLVTPSLEGGVLVLKAGKATSDARVLIRLKVHDRYNLSDESNATFTVKKVSGPADDGFPWLLAIAAVVALIAVLSILMFVLTRRRAPLILARPEPETPPAPPGTPVTAHPPSPAHMPPAEAPDDLPEAMPEDEVIQMDADRHRSLSA